MTLQLIKTQKGNFVLFLIANLFNILTALILFARPFSLVLPNVEFIWALFLVIVATALVYNLRHRRQWWSTVLPAVFLVFLFVELVFDYILKFDFRHTMLLWPYLFVFYLGQLAMIGFSFAAFKRLGFITLVTSLITLAAALFEVVSGV